MCYRTKESSRREFCSGNIFNFKTFLILGSQLALVFGICLFVIKRSRQAAANGRQFLGVTFTEETNSRGELDLQPSDTGTGLHVLTSAMIVSLFAMVFAANVSLTWGLILMTTTSLTLGPVLGMIMLSVDENDGLRVTSIDRRDYFWRRCGGSLLRN